MKKIYTGMIVFICVMISLNHYTVCASNSNGYSDELMEVACNSLSAIGFWKNIDDIDGYITRAEIADWVCMIHCNMNGLVHGEEGGAQRIYNDVSENHWAFKSIFTSRIICGQSIMNGDGNGYFRPDEYITYREFVKVLVCMIGWGFYTDYFESGYPDGYFNVANKLGIYPLDKSKMESPLTESDAVILIYNAIRAPYIGEYSLTVGRLFTYIGETYLTSFIGKDIYEVRGYAKKLDETQFLIGDAKYYCQISNAEIKEGLVICFYEENDGKRNILSCCPISSLDFDNLKPISSELPKSFWVIGDEVVEYELGLEIEGR